MKSGRKTNGLRFLGLVIILLTLIVMLQLFGAVDLFQVFPFAQRTDSNGESDVGIVEESDLIKDDEPSPSAKITIPADDLAIATIQSDDGLESQQVEIELTDEGFHPAVIVVQAGIETEWFINNTSAVENDSLLVPLYYIQIPMERSNNLFYLYPTESFDFSNQESSMYGYVKVVEDINAIDKDAIQKEVENYQPTLWSAESFESFSEDEGALCH